MKGGRRGGGVDQSTPDPRASRGRSADLPSLARRASVTIIPPGQAAAALAPLPVAALRLAEETVALLRSLGIVFIAQLANLPRESLQSRFGQEFVRRLDQALGTATEVIVARHSSPEPAAAWPLEYPTAHRETLRQVLALLIRRVAEPLAARGHGVLELACQLDCSGQGCSGQGVSLQRRPVSAHRTGRAPAGAGGHATGAAAAAGGREPSGGLGRPYGPAGRAAIRAVCRRAARASPAVGRAGRSAQQPPGPGASRAAAAQGRSPARGGRPLRTADQSGGVAAHGAAYLLAALEEPAPRLLWSSRGAWQQTAPVAPRPLRLFFPPLPLEVVAVAPDGPPARIRFAGQSHPLARHWGPERIETAWWRGRSVRRDYYRVETAEGCRFWVFRRLTDGEWFLHGEFE